MAGGKLSLPNFVAQAEPNSGIDLKGRTSLGMVDESVEADWEVIDTYNLTHARDLSVNIQGVDVKSILADGSQPVKFSVHVGCTRSQPCYSYGQVPEYFAKVALANVSRSVQGKAKAELVKKAEEAVKNIPVSPEVKNAVQDLRKKFGF